MMDNEKLLVLASKYPFTINTIKQVHSLFNDFDKTEGFIELSLKTGVPLFKMIKLLNHDIIINPLA